MTEDILSVSAQNLYDRFGRGADRSYDEIRDISDDVREKIEEEAEYIEAWHKTTHRLRDVIEQEGLLPRENSRMPSRDASEDEALDAESFPERVYFTVMEGGTYPDADQATVDVLGGRPMQVKAYLELDSLAPDEDSAYDDYMKSLLTHGTLSHEGPISSEKTQESSWIGDIQVGEEPKMPGPVAWHIHRNKEQYTEQQVQEIKESYDSQLTPAEASWLMQQNKERKRNKKSIPKPTAMKPEPDKSLEELLEELEKDGEN
jgi:hypothetical protein